MRDSWKFFLPLWMILTGIGCERNAQPYTAAP